MIGMSFIFGTRPKARTRARVLPFESGVSTGPPKQQRFTISFYLTAMLFIVFDIEIVFLYPLAVTLNALGWFAFFELLFFVVILAVDRLVLERLARRSRRWQEGTERW
jgi:NADH-quinone oxidoreductase subunit A